MSTVKLNIRKIVFTILWCVVAAMVVVLLLSASADRGQRKCSGVEVAIHGVSNNFFIDKKDVVEKINRFNGPTAKGKPISSFDLRNMENVLKREMWIQDANLYFDDNDVLQVRIEEREPVARVFMVNGGSFYIDSTAKVLPLSNKLSARVPVFTGFPSASRGLTVADSNLLKTIVHLSEYIQQDEFLRAMIEQTDITADRKFELIPKLGRQVIHFGEGIFIEEKFRNLKAFYRNIILKAGWSKYSVLDLQYSNQVVARLRDREEIVADSVRTLQLMEMIAERAQQQAADSAVLYSKENDSRVDSSIINGSVEREDNPDGGDEVGQNFSTTNNADESPVGKPSTAKPAAVMPPAKARIKTTSSTASPPAENKAKVSAAKKPPKFVMPKKQ